MTDTDHPVICGYCGAANAADAAICERCGASLAAYRSIATVPADPGAPALDPASADLASAATEIEPSPAAAAEAPPAEPAVMPRDARPTSHFRHVTYARPDAGLSSPLPRGDSPAPSGASPTATPSAQRDSSTAPPAAATSSVAFPVRSASPVRPTSSSTRVEGAEKRPPAASAASKPTPPRQQTIDQRPPGNREKPGKPRPTPAWRPPEQRRPDRLARTSSSTLITWGVGLVLFGFIISIALPNASHQALGEVIVTLATVVGIVLFIVGLTQRSGARRPGDHRPRRRR